MERKGLAWWGQEGRGEAWGIGLIPDSVYIQGRVWSGLEWRGEEWSGGDWYGESA